MHPQRRSVFTLVVLAALVPALAGVLPATAEHTRFWRQSTYDEFEKGSPKGVALRSDGRLLLAPRFAPLADPNTAYLWALRVDSKGRLYAAGGSNARVVRADDKGGTTTVFEAPELSAQAIALDAQDNLYVGTSPDGKVYRITPQGERSVFYEPKTKYIWDLALAPTGTLYVATGDKGEIFAVTPDGKGRLFYKSEETHVRALAIDRQGRLLVGTEPNGLVLRIDTKTSANPDTKSGARPTAKTDTSSEISAPPTEPPAFVLYETAKKEITALLADKDDNLYVAAVGEKTPNAPIALPQPPPVVIAAMGQPGVAPIPVQQPVFIPFPAIGGGGEVYKISPDGAPERLWSSREDLVFSLAFSPAGKLLFGTGGRGVIYQLDGNGLYSSLAKTFAGQVTALVAGRDGRVFAGTANPGKVFSLGPGPEPEGVFESQVYDARIFSQWGRLTWWGDEAATSDGVAFYLRSGNTSSPEKNWSPWAGPYHDPHGESVSLPPARFVQWKAVFKGGAPGTHADANIDWVSVAYLPKNVAPVIESIIMQNPGIRAQGIAGAPPGMQPAQPVQLRLPPPPTLPGASPVPVPQQPPQPARFEPPPQGFAQRGYQAVVWSARDDNDDDLVFTLYYRGETEKNWKLLKDKVDTKFYSWDTTTMPDGAYVLRIVASDSPSNPPDDALTSERVSERFEVVNTPPVIENLRAEEASADARVRFEARSAASVIARAEMSVDGHDWQLVFPTGRLSDSRRESYDCPAAALSPGEHTIAVRVYDEFENVTSAKVTFTTPAAHKR
jgi:sugar lactone lactonase YvrE